MLTFRYTLRRSLQYTSHLQAGITKEELDQMTYYQILGIHSKANKIEIRKAYLSLAKKMHPDLQNSPSHEFSYVARAYQTLSDDVERSVYDEELRSDNDYYVVSLGVGSLSLKTIFSVSIGAVLLTLALTTQETLEDEECPTSHRVKRLGLQNEPIETTLEEEPEKQIKWQRPKRLARIASKGGLFKESIYRDKKTDSILEDDEDLEPKILLPQDRSTITKLQEKV